MDERLLAGRHHLANGERALAQGYPDDGRAHFEAALLQFRGPELRLGEAHALRGLGRVELDVGRVRDAVGRLEEAIAAYRVLAAQLEAIDPGGLTEEHRADAIRGEADAWRLIGEAQARSGRRHEAFHALDQALTTASQLPSNREMAELWSARGQLAMRFGMLDEARDQFGYAIDIHRADNDVVGEASGWILVAELARLKGDIEGAERALENARPLAEASGEDGLRGRVLYSLGALMTVSLRLEPARAFYEAALPLVRAANDPLIEGYTLLGLGEVGSRAGAPDALGNLIAGAKAMARIPHRHGLATALLRISEHLLRNHSTNPALAASTAAWRMWRPIDAVAGGQALRVVVKALAELKAYKAVLLAAEVRADVAGTSQPNAIAVATHYRGRASLDQVTELDRMTPAAREARLSDYLDRLLHPLVLAVGVSVRALADPDGALMVVERLAGVAGSSAVNPAVLDEETEEEVTELYSFSGTTTPEPVRAVIEDDPTDEVEAPTEHGPATPSPPPRVAVEEPAEPPPARAPTAAATSDYADAYDAPPAAPEPEPPPRRESVTETDYTAFYDPPAPRPEDEDDA